MYSCNVDNGSLSLSHRVRVVQSFSYMNSERDEGIPMEGRILYCSRRDEMRRGCHLTNSQQPRDFTHYFRVSEARMVVTVLLIKVQPWWAKHIFWTLWNAVKNNSKHVFCCRGDEFENSFRFALISFPFPISRGIQILIFDWIWAKWKNNPIHKIILLISAILFTRFK